MKFTIITVCYNAENDIRRTIDSVLTQTYTEFQYIIKDGLSTDSTLKIIQEMTAQDDRVWVESSEDGGIYDAMNQAVRRAEGDFVFFLNAGDTFYDCEVLSKVGRAIDQDSVDILYGDILFEKKEGNWIKKYRNIYRYKWIYLLGDCICHQAMFAKKTLFEEKVFDTKYRICADRDWQLHFLNREKIFRFVGYTIASVPVDGFSLRNVETFELEVRDCLIEHYVHKAWIYRSLLKIKRILRPREVTLK